MLLSANARRTTSWNWKSAKVVRIRVVTDTSDVEIVPMLKETTSKVKTRLQMEKSHITRTSGNTNKRIIETGVEQTAEKLGRRESSSGTVFSL